MLCIDRWTYLLFVLCKWTGCEGTWIIYRWFRLWFAYWLSTVPCSTSWLSILALAFSNTDKWMVNLKSYYLYVIDDNYVVRRWISQSEWCVSLQVRSIHFLALLRMPDSQNVINTTYNLWIDNILFHSSSGIHIKYSNTCYRQLYQLANLCINL